MPVVLHSRIIEPHARPPPNAQIASRAPSGMRPSCAASLSATGIDADEDSAALTLDDGERLECGSVLLASGPWTRMLALQVGADLPLTVERHAVATFAWAGAEPTPGFADAAAGYYLRPEGEELFLAGGLTPEQQVVYDRKVREVLTASTAASTSP